MNSVSYLNMKKLRNKGWIKKWLYYKNGEK